MEKDNLLSRLHEHLFDEGDELIQHLDKDEQEIVKRVRGAFTLMLENPGKSDATLATWLVDNYGISKTTAFRDISRTKTLLGNVKNASKDFQRYRANEMILQGYELAKDAKSDIEVKRAVAMIRAGEALGKVNKLDKEEGEELPYGDIIPIELQSTDDVSVIPGYKRKYKSREELAAAQDRVRKRYGGESKYIEAQIVE